MITPEILYAMDKAIISILINKDLVGRPEWYDLGI